MTHEEERRLGPRLRGSDNIIPLSFDYDGRGKLTRTLYGRMLDRNASKACVLKERLRAATGAHSASPRRTQ